MNLLLLSLWQFLHALIAVVIPAACGFGLGARWATARRTRWKQRALRLQAERDEAAAAARAETEQLASLTQRLRVLRQPTPPLPSGAPGAVRPTLHVIRTGRP